MLAAITESAICARPDIGPIEALMERARRYPRAILYQTIHSISDSFDLEGMFAGGRAHSAIALRIEHALRDGGLSGICIWAEKTVACANAAQSGTDLCADRRNGPCRRSKRTAFMLPKQP